MDKITSAIYNRKRNVKTVNSGTEERQSTWNVYFKCGSAPTSYQVPGAVSYTHLSVSHYTYTEYIRTQIIELKIIKTNRETHD